MRNALVTTLIALPGLVAAETIEMPPDPVRVTGSVREIVGAEATDPNTPGSHRNRSVSRATSPPIARVIARSSTTFAA